MAPLLTITSQARQSTTLQCAQAFTTSPNIRDGLCDSGSLSRLRLTARCGGNACRRLTLSSIPFWASPLHTAAANNCHIVIPMVRLARREAPPKGLRPCTIRPAQFFGTATTSTTGDDTATTNSTGHTDGLGDGEGIGYTEEEAAGKAARQEQANKIRLAREIISDGKEGGKEDQLRAIEEAVRLIYRFEPREGQRDALWQLLYCRKDLILIARTSFGKSLILQAVSLLLDKSTTLVILPLDRIGQQQASFITRLGGRPCFLNARTISKQLLADIKLGLYSHVLLSPELATGAKFHETATDPMFKEQIGLVVIDEAHLINQWGRSFRTSYARLGVLRSYFGPRVPWFACSATLASDTLKEIKAKAGFAVDTTLIRTSIDRPEIALRLGIIPSRQKKTASALRFLFDGAARFPYEDDRRVDANISLQSIEKTIVFYDRKKAAYNDRDETRWWAHKSQKHRYTEAECRQAITVFHRELSEKEKDRILDQFRQRDSPIRVLMATEAIGIGVDLPDIRRVVLNGLPMDFDPAIPWQRGGRAARDGNAGELIILLEHWVKGPRTVVATSDPLGHNPLTAAGLFSDDSDDDGSGDESQGIPIATPSQISQISTPRPGSNVRSSKARVTKAEQAERERRGRLPYFWYRLANEPDCLREQFLRQFNEPLQYRQDINRRRCCSHCNPRSLDLGPLDLHYLYKERLNGKLDAGQKRAEARLLGWCESQLPRAFPKANFRPNTELFLPHDQLLRVIRDPAASISTRHFHEALGPWEWPEYNDELWEEFRSAMGNVRGCFRPDATPIRSQGTPKNSSWLPVETPGSVGLTLSAPQGPRFKPAAPIQIASQAPESPSVVRGTKRRVLGDISSNVGRGTTGQKRQRERELYGDITQ